MTEDKKVYEWIPITIKPNDQSLVGEVVRLESWTNDTFEEILDVGAKFIIAEGLEVYNIDCHWLIRREVKEEDNCICSKTIPNRSVTGDPCPVHFVEKKVWAHGWYKAIDEDWELSAFELPRNRFLQQHANLVDDGEIDLIWPAKQNSDGSFTEPDDE